MSRRNKRLNKKREQALEPISIQHAMDKLSKLGLSPKICHGGKAVCFIWKGSKVTHWGYSGWHSGKTIKDGRGLANLIMQLI